MKFLIADRDVSNNNDLKFMLSEYGLCDVVHDEEDFFDLIYQLDNEYDAIFMDMELYPNNAIKTLNKLKVDRKEIYDKLKLIIMADEEELISMLELWASNQFKYVKKPINKNDIMYILKEIGTINAW